MNMRFSWGICCLLISFSLCAQESAPSEAPSEKEAPETKAEPDDGSMVLKESGEAAEGEKAPTTPCDTDAASLCEGVEKGGGNLSACLATNREKLSEECKKFRGTMNKAFEKAGIKRACKDDTMYLCQDVKNEKAAYKECLAKNVEKLSADCKAEVSP